MGDREWPADITQHFEKLEEKKDTRKEESKESMNIIDQMETYT